MSEDFNAETQHPGTTGQEPTPQGVTADGHSAPPTEYSGPFAEDLANAPENAREWAAEFIKKVEGNTTKSFQEAAEFRKQWEPYSELGLHEKYPADQLGQYLQILEQLDDEETGPDLVRRLADAHGLRIQDDDDLDEDYEDPDTELREQIREELREEILGELEPRLAPFESAMQQAEQERRVSEIEKSIVGTLEQIDAERGTPLSDKQKEQVLQASMAFQDSENPVKAAYDWWTSVVSETEQGLIKSKQGEPAPAESGGQPASTPQRFKSVEEASTALKERLAAESRVAA